MIGITKELYLNIFIILFLHDIFLCRSEEWQSISEEEKKELGLIINEEGEFWMSYDDFERNYVRVEICNLSPLPDLEDQVDSTTKGWQVSFFEGKWIKDVTAGGRSCFQCKYLAQSILIKIRYFCI